MDHQLIAIAVIVIAVVVLLLYYYQYTTKSGMQNEEEFRQFARLEIDRNNNGYSLSPEQAMSIIKSYQDAFNSQIVADPIYQSFKQGNPTLMGKPYLILKDKIIILTRATHKLHRLVYNKFSDNPAIIKEFNKLSNNLHAAYDVLKIKKSKQGTTERMSLNDQQTSTADTSLYWQFTSAKQSVSQFPDQQTFPQLQARLSAMQKQDSMMGDGGDSAWPGLKTNGYTFLLPRTN